MEPMSPLFIEDALSPPFSEAWMALRRSTRVPLLTGEKLEMVRGFKPFLDSQAVDIIHPDLAFAGGITGTRKIADYAAQFRTPVALHNVGLLARPSHTPPADVAQPLCLPCRDLRFADPCRASRHMCAAVTLCRRKRRQECRAQGAPRQARVPAPRHCTQAPVRNAGETPATTTSVPWTYTGG